MIRRWKYSHLCTSAELPSNLYVLSFKRQRDKQNEKKNEWNIIRHVQDNGQTLEKKKKIFFFIHKTSN